MAQVARLPTSNCSLLIVFPPAALPHFFEAGHYVLEDAHEEILPLVRDFLGRHPLSGLQA